MNEARRDIETSNAIYTFWDMLTARYKLAALNILDMVEIEGEEGIRETLNGDFGMPEIIEIRKLLDKSLHES